MQCVTLIRVLSAPSPPHRKESSVTVRAEVYWVPSLTNLFIQCSLQGSSQARQEMAPPQGFQEAPMGWAGRKGQ